MKKYNIEKRNTKSVQHKKDETQKECNMKKVQHGKSVTQNECNTKSVT